jgi:hypothetical protein
MQVDNRKFLCCYNLSVRCCAPTYIENGFIYKTWNKVCNNFERPYYIACTYVWTTSMISFVITLCLACVLWLLLTLVCVELCLSNSYYAFYVITKQRCNQTKWISHGWWKRSIAQRTLSMYLSYHNELYSQLQHSKVKVWIVVHMKWGTMLYEHGSFIFWCAMTTIQPSPTHNVNLQIQGALQCNFTTLEN